MCIARMVRVIAQVLVGFVAIPAVAGTDVVLFPSGEPLAVIGYTSDARAVVCVASGEEGDGFVHLVTSHGAVSGTISGDGEVSLHDVPEGAQDETESLPVSAGLTEAPASVERAELFPVPPGPRAPLVMGCLTSPTRKECDRCCLLEFEEDRDDCRSTFPVEDDWQNQQRCSQQASFTLSTCTARCSLEPKDPRL